MKLNSVNFGSYLVDLVGEVKLLYSRDYLVVLQQVNLSFIFLTSIIFIRLKGAYTYLSHFFLYLGNLGGCVES